MYDHVGLHGRTLIFFFQNLNCTTMNQSTHIVILIVLNVVRPYKPAAFRDALPNDSALYFQVSSFKFRSGLKALQASGIQRCLPNDSAHSSIDVIIRLFKVSSFRESTHTHCILIVIKFIKTFNYSYNCKIQKNALNTK